MRLANLAGRPTLLVGERAIDVATASGGVLPADPMLALDRWDDVVGWAASVDDTSGSAYDPMDLRAPVPRPRQIFALALNYRPHVLEAGYTAPESPLVFTKFPACITGPYDAVTLPPGHVDWEVELVVVIGRPAFRVPAARAADVVAGLTVGQDLSERLLQLQGSPAQFSLGKSHPGFGPIGPAIVSLDEFTDAEDLAISCHLNGEAVQAARTSEMIFSIAEQIEYLTDVCPMYPGDLIFTGTPGGVGNRRQPPLFLSSGDELVSVVEGIGELRTTFTMTR